MMRVFIAHFFLYLRNQLCVNKLSLQLKTQEFRTKDFVVR